MIYFLILLIILAFLFSLSYYYIFIKKDIPFLGVRNYEWSIGISDLNIDDRGFNFNSPSNYINPVLTAKDTKLRDAQFIADPFIFKNQNDYFIFFEIMRSSKGVIGLAKSKDCYKWEFDAIVLEENFHLSYPLVFIYDDKIFMLPETSQKKEIRLYISSEFPYNWKYTETLLEGKEWFDPSIFYVGSIWYLFLGTSNNGLELYYSDNLFKGWKEHPKSPIIESNPGNTRPAGKPILAGDKLFRLAQDNTKMYGGSVKAFEITQISTENYSEKELLDSPILTGTGEGWNSLGMHHLSVVPKDRNNFIAAIDGKKNLEHPILFFLNFKIRITNYFFDKIMRLKQRAS